MPRPAFGRRFDRLSEATARRADFLITCTGCRRQILFDRATFLAVLADKHIRDERVRVSRRLTCRDCFHRGATIELVPEGSPQALRLKDGEPLPPRGISLSAWCQAGEARRRRLIREARD